MSVDQDLCRCGNPKSIDAGLCVRCSYYQSVFNPPTPAFESRRERAMKAISLRKMMKQSSKIMVVE